MYQKLCSKTYLSLLGYCCHLYVYLILSFIVRSIRQSLFWWKPHSLLPLQRNEKYQFGNKEHLGLLRREGTRIVLVCCMHSKNCYWKLTDCLTICYESMAQQVSSLYCQKLPLKDSDQQDYPDTRDLEMQLGHSQYIISIERKCPLSLASLSLLKFTFLNQHTEALN